MTHERKDTLRSLLADLRAELRVIHRIEISARERAKAALREISIIRREIGE